jgi:hypothetical protein
MAKLFMELKSHKENYQAVNNDASDLGILEFYGSHTGLAKPYYIQIRSVKNPVVKGEFIKNDNQADTEGKVFLYFDEFTFGKIWTIVSSNSTIYLDLFISESESFRFDRHGELIYSKKYTFKDASLKLNSFHQKEWVY